MNKHLYILVADQSRAKIYRADTPLQSLETVYDQINYSGRRKPAEVYSDRPGRQQNDSGGSHSFAGERETHEEERFAREICRFICDAHQVGKFDTLIMVAPPRMLGVLRKQLDHDCAQVLLNTHDKDLVKNTEQELIETLLKGNPELNVPKMLRP